MNNEWCAFLKEHEFLVGISIDGPQNYMTATDAVIQGNGTFLQSDSAIERLKSYQIEFNTLTVINNINVHYPLRFIILKSIGSKHMQFIELLETGRRILISVVIVRTHSVSLIFLCLPRLMASLCQPFFMQWVKNDVGNFHPSVWKLCQPFFWEWAYQLYFPESCKIIWLWK